MCTRHSSHKICLKRLINLALIFEATSFISFSLLYVKSPKHEWRFDHVWECTGGESEREKKEIELFFPFQSPILWSSVVFLVLSWWRRFPRLRRRATQASFNVGHTGNREWNGTINHLRSPREGGALWAEQSSQIRALGQWASISVSTFLLLCAFFYFYYYDSIMIIMTNFRVILLGFRLLFALA